MNTSANSIVVSAILSQDLVLRYNANVLFDEIEARAEDPITVDFADVRTMTRSFAQEYLSRKAKSPKTISEINVSNNIKEMFRVVALAPRKKDFIDSKKSVIIEMK